MPISWPWKTAAAAAMASAGAGGAAQRGQLGGGGWLDQTGQGVAPAGGSSGPSASASVADQGWVRLQFVTVGASSAPVA